MRQCVAAALALVALATPARATSPCVVLEPAQELLSARYAFVGEVLSRTPADIDGWPVEPRNAVRGLYRIRVIEEFKGDERAAYDVIGDWPAQAPEGSVLVGPTASPLEVGEEYLVFAWGEPARVDPCATGRLEVTKATLDALRRLPKARPSNPAPQTVGEWVRTLLDRAATAKDQDTGQSAFDALVGMGCAAVPELGKALSDDRQLPTRYLRLPNESKDAFEEFRQYGPETVGDAVAAILNHLTGRHFGFVYNGALPAEREMTVAAWREFLAKTPPEKLCSGS